MSISYNRETHTHKHVSIHTLVLLHWLHGLLWLLHRFLSIGFTSCVLARRHHLILWIGSALIICYTTLILIQHSSSVQTTANSIWHIRHEIYLALRGFYVKISPATMLYKWNGYVIGVDCLWCIREKPLESSTKMSSECCHANTEKQVCSVVNAAALSVSH